MKIQDLNYKSVCIYGFGKEGQATLRSLETYAPQAKITIADQKVDDIKVPYAVISTLTLKQRTSSFDVIIKSPGIPPDEELIHTTSLITNATQIFLDTVSAQGAKVIGVTGSKGKSTTASLIYSILKESGRRTYLVGNIGQPALDYLHYAGPQTIFVLEMSSYQLMNCTTSPNIAVITSFFAEHLDYHGTIENYFEAKSHITRFQNAQNAVFFNEKNSDCRKLAQLSPGQKVPFSDVESPVTLAETHLLGQHNLSNIAAAWKVAQYLDINRTTTLQAIKDFHNLPHRLEIVGTFHQIIWIDDAISGTPDSTIAAINAVGDKVKTLIVGGLDRGYNFTALGERITMSAIMTVILMPDTGARIAHAIQKSDTAKNKKLTLVNSLSDAVAQARAITPKGSVCLLSPASPSYNQFKNFEEKGDEFQRLIKTS